MFSLNLSRSSWPCLHTEMHSGGAMWLAAYIFVLIAVDQVYSIMGPVNVYYVTVEDAQI